MSMGRIFEFRIYKLHPGQLEAFRKRFEEGSMRLFEKHGVELHGFFETGEVPPEAVAEHSAGGMVLPAAGTRFGRDEVAYIVSFDSLEERDAVWRRLVADPEWQALRAESEERHGPIVAEERTILLTPGARSSTEKPADPAPGEAAASVPMSRKIPLLLSLLAVNAGIGLWGYASGLSQADLVGLLAATISLSVFFGLRWPFLFLTGLAGAFLLVLLVQAVVRTFGDPEPIRTWLLVDAVLLYAASTALAWIEARRLRKLREDPAGPGA